MAELHNPSFSWKFPTGSISGVAIFSENASDNPVNPITNKFGQQNQISVSSLSGMKSTTNMLCLACNGSLTLEINIKDGGESFGNLCKVLQLPLFDEYVCEDKPFCTSCLKMVEDFFCLQRKIQQLINQLAQLRELIASRIVTSFPMTSSQRPNYGIKAKIYEAWLGKINKDVRNSLEETYSSIINVLNNDKKMAANTSSDLADISSYSRTINGNGIITSASVREKEPHNQIATAEISLVVSDNSNGSMTCMSPSPSSSHDGDFKEPMDREIQVPSRSGIKSDLKNVRENRQRKERKQKDDLTWFDLPTKNTQLPTSEPAVREMKNLKQCDLCGKFFPSQSQLDMHTRIHTGEKPFECSVCSRRFATKFNMQKHSWTHDKTRYEGEPVHECDICHKKFHLKLTLYSHRRDHFRAESRPSGKNRRKRKTKSEESKMNTKKKRNSKEKAIDETVKGQSDLLLGSDEGHQNLKTKKPSQVKKRSGKTKRSTKPTKTLLSHFSEEKAEQDEHPDDDWMCDNDFDSDHLPSGVVQQSDTKSQKRLKHVKREKSVVIRKRKRPRDSAEPKRTRTRWGDGPHKCSQCEKEFKQPYALQTHMRVHTGEKPFECNVCHRTFANYGNKIKHVRTHNRTRLEGEPKLICDICGKKYHLAGTLYHHRRRAHLGVLYPRSKSDVPTSCPICGKVIKRNSHMLLHMRRQHNNVEKRYNCEICSKPFHTSSEAKDHVNYHKPDKLLRTLFRHKCPQCPPEYFGYPSKEAVRSHWAKEHVKKSLPEIFKEVVKPREAGRWECTDCPLGNRPVYKYRTGWLRHQTKYHTKKTLGDRVFSLTRHNMAANSKSSKNAESDIESESSSDEESEGIPDPEKILTPSRRSLRQRVDDVKLAVSKCFNSSESDSSETESGKKDTSFEQTSSRKSGRRGNFKGECSLKRPASLAKMRNNKRKIVCDKVPRLILTRVEDDEHLVGFLKRKNSSEVRQHSIRIITLNKIITVKDENEGDESIVEHFSASITEVKEDINEIDPKEEPESDPEHSDAD